MFGVLAHRISPWPSMSGPVRTRIEIASSRLAKRLIGGSSRYDLGMSQPGNPRCPDAACVRNLIPLVHVADVEASLAFYALLGFVTGDTMKDARGRTHWGVAESDKAQIMFAQASPNPVPEQQAVLLYMYAVDVAALRAHLLAAGLHDGKGYRGQCGPNKGRRVVFEVSHPDHMAGGELRIADPDGYCILVGQLE